MGKQPVVLHIQLLGAFTVFIDGKAIPAEQWRLKKARSLVKLLALAPGHRLQRDQILETLWPDADPASAANVLYQMMHAARKLLSETAQTEFSALPQPASEGFLTLEDGVLHLDRQNRLSIDVEQFETAAGLARDSLEQERYQSALAYYRGELLPEDRYEDWTIERREALRQTYLRLLLELAHLQESRTEYAAGIETLAQAVAADKADEEAHLELMRLYALNGQRQMALRQYHLLKEVLQAELAVEPSAQAIRLYEAIQSNQFPVFAAPAQNVVHPPVSRNDQVLVADLPPEFSPPPAAGRHPNNLPIKVSSFIGREAQIAEITGLLEKNRLVTLHGSGGTGKTRLALEVAARLLEHYPDGAWLVELASLSDPDIVPQTVAAALGLQRTRDISYPDMLVNYLRGKHLLLVLDNCEHLLDACARLADTLLRGCPKLTLLTTSREALGITGEVAYRVPSLAAPDPAGLPVKELAQSEAVRLFVERAAAVQPGFVLAEPSVPVAAHLCHRLDGIPLAIELAAAWVRVLSVEQIAARLDDAVREANSGFGGTRFRLLTGGSRTALPRQRTLRASIDWSYSLLPEAERRIFQRLSVFYGGWTLEAMEQVCAFDGPGAGETLDGLAALVNKSLVVAEASTGQEVRYRMLETIRQFAQEKLDESGQGTEARDRHLDYFRGLAVAYGPLLRTPRIGELLDRLDLELDNLRRAISWALNQGTPSGAEKAVTILDKLRYFWFTRLIEREEIDWAERAIPFLTGRDPQGAELRAKALFLSGFLLVLNGIDTLKGKAYLEESAYLFHQVGNRPAEALSLSIVCFGIAQMIRYKRDERKRFDTEPANLEDYYTVHQKHREILQDLPQMHEPESRWLAASSLLYAGVAAGFLMENDVNRDYNQQAKAIFIELGDRLGELIAIRGLANEALKRSAGEANRILLDLERAIEAARSMKVRFLIPMLLVNCGLACYRLNRYQEMVAYFTAALELYHETGTLWDEITPARMRGVGLYHLEDFPQARARLFECLEMSYELGFMKGFHACLIFLAAIAARTGAAPQAVKLLGFIERSSEDHTTPTAHWEALDRWDKDTFEQTVVRAKQSIPAAEFEALWQQGREMSMEQAREEAREEAQDKG